MCVFHGFGDSSLFFNFRLILYTETTPDGRSSDYLRSIFKCISVSIDRSSLNPKSKGPSFLRPDTVGDIEDCRSTCLSRPISISLVNKRYGWLFPRFRDPTIITDFSRPLLWIVRTSIFSYASVFGFLFLTWQRSPFWKFFFLTKFGHPYFTNPCNEFLCVPHCMCSVYTWSLKISLFVRIEFIDLITNSFP